MGLIRPSTATNAANHTAHADEVTEHKHLTYLNIET
jgi:hypothetical protein